VVIVLMTFFALVAHPASAGHTGGEGGPYRPGRDVFRDMELTGPSSGYVLEANGHVNPFGGAPGVVVQPTFSFRIARSLEIWYSGGGSFSGYVLSGYGSLHPWATAGAPLPPGLEISPWWPGWDIARDFEFTQQYDGTSKAAGFILSGYGSLHRFASSGAVVPQAIDDGPYWPNFDIARDLELSTDGPGQAAGLILSGWGSLHAWSTTGLESPATPTDGPWWPGWDIARDFAWEEGVFGWVLSGWGSTHGFNGATPLSDTPYFPGVDIARDLKRVGCSGDDGAAQVLDGWGARHPAHFVGWCL
jgi:hypothetical protein